MKIADIILIAIGLAMDAFAVSIAAGTSGKLEGRRGVFRLSFHFGLFQAIMPLAGWFVGVRIAHFISAVDHWVAFGLLCFVGARMIRASLKNETASFQADPSRGMSLVMLSVATSIDALAVGLSLAMIQINIWYPCALIGIITAAMSVAGIGAGKYLGRQIGPLMERLGGVILIFIGARILWSHLFNG